MKIGTVCLFLGVFAVLTFGSSCVKSPEQIPNPTTVTIIADKPILAPPAVTITVTSTPPTVTSYQTDPSTSPPTPTRIATVTTPTYVTPYLTQEQKNVQSCIEIAKQYHTSHTYIGTESGYAADIFVCGDMSSDGWDLLVSRGINAKIEIGDPTKSITHVYESTHAWVLAETSPNSWLALETTGGFVVYYKDNPLYYSGWSFSTPKQLKDYMALMQQLKDQVIKYDAAATEYNRLVNLYNQTTNANNRITILVQLNAQAAVVTQRTNDVNQTQTQLVSLFSQR